MVGGQGAPPPGKGPDPSLVTVVPKTPRLTAPQRGAIVGATVEKDTTTGQVRRVRGLVASPGAQTPVAAARQFLTANRQVLGLSADLSELHLAREVTSLTGHHVTLEQQCWGLPVFGGQLSVHTDLGLAVTLVNNDLVPVTAERKPALPIDPQPAIGNAVAAVNANSAPTVPPAATLGVLVDHGKPVVAWRVTVSTRSPAGAWVVMVRGSDNKVLSIRNDARFADGAGMVYNPNPIVVTGDVTLRDNNNADSPVLTAARESVVLHGLDGTGYLTGTYCTTAPSDQITRAYQPSLNFNYTRSQTGFDETMCYYHVDRIARYLQSIGFANVENRQVAIDVDGVPDQNAWYDPTTLMITFGTGDVNAAQDAHVVWHENGHAIQDNQVPGWGATEEGGAMGEGFGDYWGASQFAGTGPMGNAWDVYLAEWFAADVNPGNPPYLRRMDGTKHYPEDMDGEVHDDGEIWSACLWLIRGIAGHERSDRIILEAHFALSPDASFRDGALAILDANKALYGDADRRAIRNVFIDRGILFGETATALAANETSGTVGATATLTAKLTRLDDGSALAGKTVSFTMDPGTDPTVVGTAVTDASGVASLNYSISIYGPVGDRTFSAKFAGDYDFAPSSGLNILHVGGYSVSGTVTDGGAPLAGTTIQLTGPGTTSGSYSASPYAAIPDGNLTGIYLPIAVPDLGTLQSVRIAVTITHPWIGDVEVSIVAPDGTSVILHPYSGDSSQNLDTSYPDLTAPAQSLAVLKGKSVVGTWRLHVRDVYYYFSGTLDTWGLKFSCGSPNAITTATTDASGAYTAAGLSPGTFHVVPSKTGFGFSPDSRDVTVPPSATGVDFATTGVPTKLVVPDVTGKFGDTVTLSATLTQRADGTPLAGKTLSFQVEGVFVGTSVTAANGLASVQYTIPTAVRVGKHPIQVDFAGQPPLNPTTGTGTLTATGYSVSGTVRTPMSDGVPGVTVTAVRTANQTTSQAASPSLPIPDNNQTGVTSTINVPVDGVLSSVTVGVNITHSWIGDLVVTVIHPDGTEVILHNMTGDDQQNLITSYPDQTAPDGNLDTLTGKPIKGTWKLKVQDLQAEDTGVLNSWSLKLGFTAQVQDGGTTTDGAGHYTISNLDAYTYTIIPSAPAAKFNPTSRSVTLGPDATGIDFDETGIATLIAVPDATGSIGSNAVLSATLTRASDGAPLRSRLVNFSVGSWSQAVATNAAGLAAVQYPVAPGTPASQAFTASFDGDASYFACTGSATLTISKGDTALAVSNASGVVGGSAGLNATLTLKAGGAALSGKTLHFAVGSWSNDAVTDNSGLASVALRIPEGLVGNQPIAVSFAGDANYNAVSATGTLTVGKCDTTVAVASVSGSVGASVSLSATLRRGSDGTVLKGRTIHFAVGSWSADAVTNASGVATKAYTVPSGSVGKPTIAAGFAGDADYNAGNGSGTLTIVKVDTTLTVQKVSGQIATDVTLKAVLTRNSDNNPLAGETVHFAVGTWSEDATTDGTGLATADYSIPEEAAGDQSVAVAFAGDDSYNATSGNGTLTVTKADTGINWWNVGPAPVGSTVTLQAELYRRSPGAMLSGRTVHFAVGAWSADGVTNSIGRATVSYTIAAGTVGVGAIQLTFAGDDSYNPSSSTASITVTKGDTALSVAPATVTVGASTSLTATLTRTLDGTPVVGETVRIAVGGWSASGTTNASGTAAVTYTAPAGTVGSGTIAASFSGDDNYGSSSANGALTVVKAGTAMVVSSASGAVGSAVNLTASLTRVTDHNPLAGKTVRFVVGAWSQNGTTDASGAATVAYTVPASAFGTNTIVATFAGDADYNGSTATNVLTGQAPPHPSDTNQDLRIVIGEVTGYASAWKKGQGWPTGPSPIAIDYVTNSSSIWRKGETYHYDNSLAAPLCWVSGTRASGRSGAPTSTIAAARLFSTSTYRHGTALTVTIKTTAGSTVAAWAVEEVVPAGWVVSGISDGGQVTTSTGTVRWGPFNTTGVKSLTYKATPPSNASGSKTFTGLVSADGRHGSVAGTGSINGK